MSNNTIRKRITHWTIKVQWDNGEEEFLDYIPNYVASAVDEFLTEIEIHNKDEHSLTNITEE